jgi:Cu-Zn family superoxide dismutase
VVAVDRQEDLMSRPATTSLLTATAVALLVGCGSGDEAPEAPAGGDTAAAAEQSGGDAGDLTATLVDAGGSEVGTVTLSEAEGGVQLSVDVTGLPPGFHGFHVHSIGVCEPDSANPSDPSQTGDFLSAGGHIGAGESDHGAHPGDLPVLYVPDSGTASMTAATEALTLADLTDDDGSAVMVHAAADNYANVPERYAPDGPDEMTLNTGDAGGRIACGTVEDPEQG